jgi:ketosteroid isomerase-like protein
MSSSHLVLLVAGISLIGACGSPQFDAAAESRILLQRDAEWAQAASDGKDIEKIVSYWSDDAVVIPQGQPVAEGKAAIRDFVTASFQIPGFKIHWVSDKVSFSPDGKLAYMRSGSKMTMTGPAGTPISVPGRSITVWRMEPDGQWRCVVDIWNDPPPVVNAQDSSGQQVP